MRKHPEVDTIEDVVTFRLNLLVAIEERAGQHWSERLFDLSMNEWRLLALIKSRGPCRASDLADLLLMDKSQTSRSIKVLLKKKLILNLPDVKDGRAVTLELTETGKVQYDQVFAEVLESNERILSVLNSKEVAMFDSVLRKLVSHSQDLLERRLGRQLVR
ncbi:MAG: MarR family winged helix-turn-helix transcriptional regulator [Sulfitobacter sp.]